MPIQFRTTAISLWLITAFLFGCAKDHGPQEVLREFVQLSFSPGFASEEITKYFTGEMRDYYQNLPESEKKIFMNLEEHHFKSVKILSESTTVDESSLTFVVKYEYKDHAVDVRKVAKLVRATDGWKIADVQTVKTYIEGASEILVK